MPRLPAGVDEAVRDLPVGVGDVVEIPEGDYCYGSGALLIRVTEIVPPHPQFPGATWTFVKGIELRRTGEEARERHVLARLTALRRHVDRHDVPEHGCA
jgi:hypothetical protein